MTGRPPEHEGRRRESRVQAEEGKLPVYLVLDKPGWEMLSRDKAYNFDATEQPDGTYRVEGNVFYLKAALDKYGKAFSIVPVYEEDVAALAEVEGLGALRNVPLSPASGAQSGRAAPPSGSTRERVESPGEGGEGYTKEVPDGLPGMELLSFDSGRHQLELTGGAREYLGRLGLVRPTEGRVLLNKGAEETARILTALGIGRYALDKPGADLVSKVRGTLPLDGDGEAAVLWVTEEQRLVLDRVLRAKVELDLAKGNTVLKGPAEAAYQQWLTVLINPTAATAPESSPASPKAKRSLFGEPNTEFGKKARTALGAAARFGLWFYFLPKYHEDTWKQTEEERREKRARKAASEPSPYSPMEAAWAPEPLPEPAVQAEPPIDWGAQFGDEGGKT